MLIRKVVTIESYDTRHNKLQIQRLPQPLFLARKRPKTVKKDVLGRGKSESDGVGDRRYGQPQRSEGQMTVVLSDGERP